MTFQNLNKVVEHLASLGWTPDTRYDHNGAFTLIVYPKNRAVFEPQPLMSPLYRGQSTVYDTCYASLHRKDLSEVDRFIERLRLLDFEFLLQDHPIVQEEEEAGLFVDYVGFAQHYGIKTELLDITNSLIVAAFFATTKYQPDGNYTPIIDPQEKGVLYFIPPLFDIEFAAYDFLPLGLKCFRRPGEQRAFSIGLKQQKDLNNVPGVFRFEFYQDREISEQIFETMKQGDTLFPFDPVERKVNKIRELREFSIHVFNEAYHRYKAEVNLSQHELINLLEDIGIVINSDDRLVKYTREEIRALIKEKEDGNMFLNSHVTTRLVYIPPED